MHAFLAGGGTTTVPPASALCVSECTRFSPIVTSRACLGAESATTGDAQMGDAAGDGEVRARVAVCVMAGSEGEAARPLIPRRVQSARDTSRRGSSVCCSALGVSTLLRFNGEWLLGQVWAGS